MAEVVLGEQASALGLGERLVVESAGVAAEVGFDLDRRARKALERRSYRPPVHRAQQFQPRWLDEFDLVIAMDRGHLRWLERHAPKDPYKAEVRLFLSYPSAQTPSDEVREVPDPYYGDERGFEACLDLIELGCTSLLAELAPELAAG